ncbi:UDP-N-acetylmuramate dehydrogenase [Candidatus Saccharibacteria bacterium]|nr:UDP-N-acetylmuramate dehydrogenase [Candidatus Saccharibacteria bacterium]
MIIRENILLSELTTMRLGGPARFVVDIDDPADIPAAFDFAASRKLPFFILGGGANTIAHDEGFPGVIIRFLKSDIKLVQADDDYLITASAGTPWDDVVAFATARNLTGIEALSKIPGLTGAAPVQNIGAYGQDVAAVFVSAEAYDIAERHFVTLYHSDFSFSYRRSILNTTKKNQFLITSITLRLSQGQMSRPFYNSIERYISEHHITDFSPAQIRQIVSTIRADKLPDPAIKPSSGSFFKNIYLTKEEASLADSQGYPIYHGRDGYKINSGWLIEQTGFKGRLLHGIRVNEKAALVLINESASSYQDLANARAEIVKAVQQKFGFNLEQEPVEILPTIERPKI